VILVAHQFFHVEERGVAEALPGLAQQEGFRVDAAPLFTGVFGQHRLFGAFEHAIEAAQHGERQNDLTVFRLLVIAPQQVSDRPDESLSRSALRVGSWRPRARGRMRWWPSMAKRYDAPMIGGWPCSDSQAVSAWTKANGVCLGQVKTEAKSTEIAAIPQLLERLELRGFIVTLDAMGGQREMAKAIQDKEADYVLAVKDHQPKLSEAIVDHPSDRPQSPEMRPLQGERE
jgi:hypothetical protein